MASDVQRIAQTITAHAFNADRSSACDASDRALAG
jgi:hypothetical protein